MTFWQSVTQKCFHNSCYRPDRELLVPYPTSESEEDDVKTPPKVAKSPDIEVLAMAAGCPKKTDEPDAASTRFRPPSSADVLHELATKKFAPNTEKKIMWAVNLFQSWREERLKSVIPETEIVFSDLTAKTLLADNLAYSISAFLNEVKRHDGAEFGAKGLYNLVIMLQFYLEKKGLKWKLCEDDPFLRVRYTLDNLMKMRCADRVSITKSSVPLTYSDEEKMWANGSLGEDEPTKLRNTVMFLLGLSCALRGGQEHRNLRCPGHDCQFTVCSDSATGRRYLRYCEDERSKTNQGGLVGRRQNPKVVKIYGNDDLNRNVVRLFLKYTSLLPVDGKCSALYKYPLATKKLRASTWYTDKPVGVKSLKKIVSNLAKEAGLVGHYSNHSLRASTATRMYQSGVDEQVIKEITGHKSDSVRSYKRTSEELLRHASATIVRPGVDMTHTVSAKHAKILESLSSLDTTRSSVDSQTAEFDIDTIDLTQNPMFSDVVVPNSRVNAHNGSCPMADKNGACLKICSFLHKIDLMQAERKVKRMRLSLKYRKK